MKAYTSTLVLLTNSLICLHKALVSHLKLVPGFRACSNYEETWQLKV